MKQQPCDICGTTLRVKFRQVFPRHYRGEEPCNAILCDDCDDQFHWRVRTKPRYRGGPPPFGYHSVDGQLLQDREQIEVVQEIIARRLAGDSFSRIANELEFYGVPSKLGGSWNATTVTAIFEREAPKFGVESEKSHIRCTRFGYRQENGCVVPDEEEQKVIRWILRAREHNLSFSRIAERLNEYKVPTKRGGAWSVPQVSTIFRRESH